jgi:hypothetical protein
MIATRSIDRAFLTNIIPENTGIAALYISLDYLDLRWHEHHLQFIEILIINFSPLAKTHAEVAKPGQRRRAQIPVFVTIVTEGKSCRSSRVRISPSAPILLFWNWHNEKTLDPLNTTQFLEILSYECGKLLHGSHTDMTD